MEGRPVDGRGLRLRPRRHDLVAAGVPQGVEHRPQRLVRLARRAQRRRQPGGGRRLARGRRGQGHQRPAGRQDRPARPARCTSSRAPARPGRSRPTSRAPTPRRSTSSAARSRSIAPATTLVVTARGEDGGGRGTSGNPGDNTVEEAGAVYVFRVAQVRAERGGRAMSTVHAARPPEDAARRGRGAAAAAPARAARPARDVAVPPQGIGRRIRHLSYSDIGGKPDSVQIMLNRRHLYVGHMFSNGLTILDASDPAPPEAGRLLHRRRLHAHASPAGGRGPAAPRQRRQHRRDAVLRQPARLLRERARRQHHQPQEVPLGPEHPRHLAVRRRCGRSRSSRCPGSASTGCGGPAAATPTWPRTSTASPITSSASSTCRRSPSRRSSRAGGCPA